MYFFLQSLNNYFIVINKERGIDLGNNYLLEGGINGF
jgi:hypothetical protein